MISWRGKDYPNYYDCNDLGVDSGGGFCDLTLIWGPFGWWLLRFLRFGFDLVGNSYDFNILCRFRW